MAIPKASINTWRRYYIGNVMMAIVYSLLLLVTTSNYFGDTGWYAGSIVQYDRGISSRVPSLLWESGHLYWRPIGLVLYRHFRNLTPYVATRENELAVIVMLVGVTTVSGFVCALLFYSLASLFLKQQWAAVLVATAFLSSYAFLDYVHTGSAYVPGLLAALMGLRLAIWALEHRKSAVAYALLSGALVGAAALLWLPYILVLPGVFAVSLLWTSKDNSIVIKDRMRLTYCITTSAIFIMAVGYVYAILQLSVSSLPDVKEWLLAAGHGSSQSKRLLRLATGLPRSFIYIGNGGLFLKRYVLHDPYSQPSLKYLFAHYLWKLLIFYLAAVSLLLSLLRDAYGRRMLCILLAGSIPTLIFAVAIFEPGSTERYLPIYPFACITVAYVLSRFSKHAVIGSAILALGILLVGTNWAALSKAAQEKQSAATISRIVSVRDKVTPQGLVALVTFNDDLYQFTVTYPFNAVNREVALPVYDVIQVANVRILRWRQEFALRALQSLNQPASVWVSKRLLAEKPDPAWNWVEGDDARIAWKDLPVFFEQFSYADSIGGADGFVRLSPSSENKQKLEAISQSTAGDHVNDCTKLIRRHLDSSCASRILLSFIDVPTSFSTATGTLSMRLR